MMKHPYQMTVIDSKTGKVKVMTENKLPEMTQQQWKDECDVNNIVRRYAQTGELTHLARSQGVYADVSEITDYHDMVEKIKQAEEAFMTLSAPVRKRFANDPGEMISFLQDPKNREEAISLGLVERPKPIINDDQKPKTNDDKPKT